MERIEYNNLITWKNSKNRKPLIIRGARQVGKTWLMKAFGEKEYKQSVYINFESNSRMQQLFEGDFDIKRIIAGLQIESGLMINSDDTLIIFDEIQEAPKALTSLKYFCESAPQYHLISAGSMLGVALHKETSFPVGKVSFLDLKPLSFIEFLNALGENPLISLLETRDWSLIKTFNQKFIHFLRLYYFIGGMPEAVWTYCQNKNFNEVREIQKRIIIAYEQDFSKHAPTDIVPRIRMVWNSIPAQLAKENRKFIYGMLKEGARAKEYEMAITWLTDCGLAYKINRAKKPGIPLNAFEDFGSFKLFLVDLGLMNAMGNMDVKTLIDGNTIFQEFKGAVTEQYVLQQIISENQFVVYYWSAEKSAAEIDFLVQFRDRIIPIEVKAEENLQAKSLKIYCQKYNPKIAVRTSMSDFRKETWLTNLPLYAISELKNME